MAMLSHFRQVLIVALAITGAAVAAPQLVVPAVSGLSDQNAVESYESSLPSFAAPALDLVERTAAKVPHSDVIYATKTLAWVATTRALLPLLTETVTPGVTPTCAPTPRLTIDLDRVREGNYVQNIHHSHPASAYLDQDYESEVTDITSEGDADFGLLARPPGMKDCQNGCKGKHHYLPKPHKTSTLLPTHHSTKTVTKHVSPSKHHSSAKHFTSVKYKPASRHHPTSKHYTASFNLSASARPKPSRTVHVWVDPALHTRPTKNSNVSHHASTGHHASSRHCASSGPCKPTTQTLTTTATASVTIVSSLTIHPSSGHSTHESHQYSIVIPASTGSAFSHSPACHCSHSTTSTAHSTSDASRCLCQKPILKTTFTTASFPYTQSTSTSSTTTVTVGCKKIPTTTAEATDANTLFSPAPSVVIETEVKTEVVTYCPDDDETTPASPPQATVFAGLSGSRETEIHDTIVREMFAATLANTPSASNTLAARHVQEPLQLGDSEDSPAASSATTPLNQQYLPARETALPEESGELDYREHTGAMTQTGDSVKVAASFMLLTIPILFLAVIYLL